MKKINAKRKRITPFVFSLVVLLLIFNTKSIEYPSGGTDLTYGGGGPTNISGILSTDTVLALTNNPFIVVGNILVAEGVSLTIEPGVEVKFDGNYTIQIDGRINATGTVDNKIIFTSNNELPKKGDWNKVFFSNPIEGENVLKYCEISYGTVGIYLRGFINCQTGCDFYYCPNPCDGDSVLISHCLFHDNEIALHYEKLFSDSTDNNANYLNITNNAFHDNDYGIIIEIGRGINGGPLGEISYNTIQNNQNDGILLLGRNDIYEGRKGLHHRIIHNNILGNRGYGLNSQVTDIDFSAEQNWWGTDNTSLIGEYIYDFFGDFSYKQVNYSPILSYPEDSAPIPAPRIIDIQNTSTVSVNLSWSQVPISDIGGYMVYYNSESTRPNYSGTGANEGSSPIDVGNNTSIHLTGLYGKTYYFSVKTYDSDGEEGYYSAEEFISLKNTSYLIYINEFLANPGKSKLEWIELFNQGAEEVDLSGWILQDTGSGSNEYIFPTNTSLASNEFIALYSNITNITLGNLGDTIILKEDNGQLVDEYTYFYSQRGKSIGREVDGEEEWTQFDFPTPGGTNEGVNDTNPPGVILDYPLDGVVDTDGNLFLKYTPTDLNAISDCVLYTNISGNWQITQVDSTVIVNSQNSFGLFNLANGTYIWNVLCTDDTSLSGTAIQSQTLTVIKSQVSNNLPINASINATVNVTVNQTKTSISLNVTENVTDANLIISSNENQTKINGFSIPNLGRYVSIETNTELEESITDLVLKMYYTDEELESKQISETDLAIYWYDQNQSNWVELDWRTMNWVHATGINKQEKYLWANIDHFSDYTLALTETAIKTQQNNLAEGWNLISIPIQNIIQ